MLLLAPLDALMEPMTSTAAEREYTFASKVANAAGNVLTVTSGPMQPSAVLDAIFNAAKPHA